MRDADASLDSLRIASLSSNDRTMKTSAIAEE
jgi:hypothetical protein